MMFLLCKVFQLVQDLQKITQLLWLIITSIAENAANSELSCFLVLFGTLLEGNTLKVNL